MIVPFYDHEDDARTQHDLLDHGECFPGCVSGWMEKSEEPSRPIGFRMPEREEPPVDPSWMLL